MKYFISLFFLTALSAPALSAAAVTPQLFSSIGLDLQNQVIVQQTTVTSSYGLRYASSNYQSALQTFTWEGSESLTGVGLKLAANSSNQNGGTLNYELRVFEISALALGSEVSSTLGTYQFSMAGDFTTSTDYLYLALPTALTMADEGTYMFQIIQSGTSSKRLTLATAQSGTSTYDHGVGYVYYSSTTDAPTVVAQNAVVTDYMFFLTGAAIPEPQTLALLMGALAGLGAIVFRKMRVSRF